MKIIEILSDLIKRIMLIWYPMSSTDHDVIPIPTPVFEPPTEPINAVKTPSIADLALAIRDFEGKPGDQNYRLNNPGNCRYNPTGYLPMYGKVGRSKNNFAIFKDYATGWLYLQNMIKVQIHNNPNETLLQFMTRYAPPSDDNPTVAYAKFIAKRLGITISFKMGNLV